MLWPSFCRFCRLCRLLPPLDNRGWATATARKLRADGYIPRVSAIDWPGYSGTPHGLEGMRVRTGVFPTQAAARSAAAALQALGFWTAAAEWTGYDQDQPPDAEHIREAIIDPTYPINGINRIPGIIEDCGRPGSRPTSRPRQDVTCTDNNELVLFTGQFGASTPSGSGIQADLGPGGRVLSVGARAAAPSPSAAG